MTDLRKAAEMALEALEWHVSQTRPIQKTTETIEALRQALAQPEQVITPISPDQYERFCGTCGACTGKPWVGLTDDEINDFDKKLRDNGDYCSLHFAWGISAKLKRKNGGSI